MLDSREKQKNERLVDDRCAGDAVLIDGHFGDCDRITTGRCKYVTVLREPLSHRVSEYDYLCRRPGPNQWDLRRVDAVGWSRRRRGAVVAPTPRRGRADAAEQSR